MSIHRELTEKEEALKKHTHDGKVHCFFNNHPIEDESNIDFHHFKPYLLKGPTKLSNLASICKKHHRVIGILSITEFRARLKLEDFFNHPNSRKLDDLLEIKVGANGYTTNIKTGILNDKIRYSLTMLLSLWNYLCINVHLQDMNIFILHFRLNISEMITSCSLAFLKL